MKIRWWVFAYGLIVLVVGQMVAEYWQIDRPLTFLLGWLLGRLFVPTTLVVQEARTC